MLFFWGGGVVGGRGWLLPCQNLILAPSLTLNIIQSKEVQLFLVTLNKLKIFKVHH